MNGPGPTRMDNTADRTSVLIVTTLSSFLAPFMAASLNIALPSIGNELVMDAMSLGWVATAYLLASVIFVVPFGRIADIYGRKRLFSYGMIIFTVTSLLLALSSSPLMLIALRFVQGIGSAMIFGISAALLISVFPPAERGKVLGFTVAAVYSGQSVGPFIGGLLTQHFGWRSIFLLTGILCLLVIALIFWKLKGEWAESKGEKFDIVGSAIYSVGLVALVYGFTHLPDILGAVLILIGIIGLVTFVMWETKSSSPVLEINLFRQNRAFAFSCLAALINYGATYAVGFLLSLYLQYIKGFNPETAGFVLVSQPIIQALFSPLAGRISDTVQPRIVASAGMTCTTVGLLLFIFLSEGTSVPLIVGNLVLLGFGFALFSSPNTNALMSSVEKRFYGVASATLTTMRLLGMIVSMGIVMLLFALYIGRVQITPEYYGAFLQTVRITFIISAVLCFFGIFASLARGKVGDSNQQHS